MNRRRGVLIRVIIFERTARRGFCENIIRSYQTTVLIESLSSNHLDRWRDGPVKRSLPARDDTFNMVSMSKGEILEELSKLTKMERQEIRLRLAELDNEDWLDDEDPLTDHERALLDARLAAYAKDPDAGSTWEEVEGRIRARVTFSRIQKYYEDVKLVVDRVANLCT